MIRKREILSCILAIASFCSIVLGSRDTGNDRRESLDTQGNDKNLRICSISGGLDITRWKSNVLQNVFLGALEDVELIREYISEAARNQGIMGGLHDLQEMSSTLDWAARNMSKTATTLSAGLGYVDDRLDRRVERFVGTINEPYTGSKSLDMAMIDSASNIYPWLVDRRSDEKNWWFSHHNGRLVPGSATFCDQLYVAAWIGSRGEAWMYYPPYTKTVGRAYSFADVLGANYNSTEEAFVKPNLPENNPDRAAYFSKPYADTAVPGLSLITAQAPVYFDGEFRGTRYNDVYVASAGVDISMDSISNFVKELEGTLTQNSFAFVVDSESFDMLIISQVTVGKIYPERTGFEEARVTFSKVDGSILSDRRNQTYLPSDTVFQSPLDLDNADWSSLAAYVRETKAGQRSWLSFNVVLSGEKMPTPFYVMSEKWDSVADWTMIVFTPIEEVDGAIRVSVDTKEVNLAAKAGEIARGRATLTNEGTMDTSIRLSNVPKWLTLLTDITKTTTLGIGESLALDFEIRVDESSTMESSISSFIAVTIEDDEYPDCFYQDVRSIVVNVRVLYEEELNYLTNIRPYGLVLAAITMFSSMAWSWWVFRHKRVRVVRASQPIFLHMMCAGIFLMGTSIIPMAIDDSIASAQGCNIACMSIPWLLAMGFSITFSALFSKIWRINQIVEACLNLKRVKVSARDVIIPFVAIFSLNTVILALWSIIAPIEWVREDVIGKGAESIGYCSMSKRGSLLFVLMLVVLNFLALVLALIQLYKARELSTEYSEGKYIAIAIGSMVQVFLTGFPLLILVRQNPHATYFVKSTVVFVVSMSLLLLTFLPKYATMRQEEQKRCMQAREKTKDEDDPVCRCEVRRTEKALQGQSSCAESQFAEDDGKSCAEGETISSSTEHEGYIIGNFTDVQLISDVTDSLFTISETEAIISCKDEDFISMFDDEDAPRDFEPIAKLTSNIPPLMRNILSEASEMATPPSLLDPTIPSRFSLHESRPRDSSPRMPSRRVDLMSYVGKRDRPSFSTSKQDIELLDSLPTMPTRFGSDIENASYA